jgi:ribonuclease H / adenosylcobalamin/alpha-ribazole phosphatase
MLVRPNRCLYAPSRLLLVRHGTIDGLSALVGRTPDVALNAQGRIEVAALGSSMSGTPLWALFTSPQPRAVQTAQAIGEARGLSPQVAPEFDEIDFGAWTGSSFLELATDERWRAFNQDRLSAAAPGGETMVQVLERVRGGLRRISALAKGRPIAIVTHAEIIRCAVIAAFGLSLNDWTHLQPAPASVTRLFVDASGTCSASLSQAESISPAGKNRTLGSSAVPLSDSPSAT